ncbi:hypothetical protein GCM10027169_06520 [Gordonia jinhuaensis]|uniref:DUF2516 family protein n=2 Tax=Gordonia jinhuaensis TaxID=1517702 RepID=A0A916SWZ6_9ACTN|nr:hypothetical protein GCM10011489_06130 [Gordonia jinhuaensis]
MVMGVVSVLHYGQSLILLLLTIVGGVAAVVALVHAISQRPDAFTAVDKQSKKFWVIVLALAAVFIWIFGAISLLGIIGIVAVLVYLVDVRPRVDSIQGRHWFRKS